MQDREPSGKNKGDMKTLVSKSLQLALPRLPRNRFGDGVFDYINFVRNHRRFPGSREWISDLLFEMKRGQEIERPARVFTTDKHFAKFFVSGVIGSSHAVETLAILRSPEDVRAYVYPDRCCIKPTHISQTVLLRDNGEEVPIETVTSWLEMDHYTTCRERNYRSLEPKIIVEPIVFGDTNLNDYKFFCYQGAPKFVQVDVDRRSNHTRSFYDLGWKKLDFSVTYPNYEGEVARPECFDLMVDACRELAAHFSFVRIDFYTNGREFLVGEITHCPGSACEAFTPRQAEAFASELLFAGSS